MPIQRLEVQMEIVCNAADGVEKVLTSAGLEAPQCTLEARPIQFDGIELWRVWRQEENADCRVPDSLEYEGVLVNTQIVHHEHVPSASEGQKIVLEEVEKLRDVDRPLERSYRNNVSPRPPASVRVEANAAKPSA